MILSCSISRSSDSQAPGDRVSGSRDPRGGAQGQHGASALGKRDIPLVTRRGERESLLALVLHLPPPVLRGGPATQYADRDVLSQL